MKTWERDLRRELNLPWKPYERSNGSWIFSDTLGAEELVEKLKQNNGRTRIGEYIFNFSGKERRFIARFPVEK